MSELNKITIHYTAGSYFPNQHELQHYHFLIDKNGKIYKGKFKPEDNINCYDGKYAAHCGGGNTGNISIAVCGMMGFKNRHSVGKYPITYKQIEKCFELCASLVLKYKIPINRHSIFTHYEFGLSHPYTTSRGKIDIIHIPTKQHKHYNASRVGDLIRNKVYWYFYQLKISNKKILREVLEN